MEAKTINLERLFDGTVSYQIPLFQRPYVWGQLNNWEPLWDDIQTLLERRLQNGIIHSHFLGAVVLEQLNNSSGSIECRQVIDGQQRFTTLQIIILTIRDICLKLKNEKYFERFIDLVCNKKSKVDNDYEYYKIWPTNGDREAYKAIHDLKIDTNNTSNLKGLDDHKIVQAYLYYIDLIDSWIKEAQDEFQDMDSDDLLDILWQLFKSDLQLVVIDLDNSDESQVIFETLNARGTQLLPADLIKNMLFRKGQSINENIEKLYNDYWKPFDSPYWRKEIKQGRFKRPRIDIYLAHYLSMALKEEVRHSRLFEGFKQYVLDTEKTTYSSNNGLFESPVEIHGHLKSLKCFSEIFENFSKPESGSYLEIFMQRLIAIDTSTVYPLLLISANKLLPDNQAEFVKFLKVLESFLFRRMICGLSTKNYNKIFINAIKYLDSANEVSANELTNFLFESDGESIRFPSDLEFRDSLENSPLYSKLAQYKMRAILIALDLELLDKKSEQIVINSNLTIEHIIPQKWQTTWPIPENIISNAERKIEFINKRNEILHTLGNLTLITGSLNPSISNGCWKNKRVEICKFSKLNLNQYFHFSNDALEEADIWNEDAILKRSKHLADIALKVWPRNLNF